MAREKSTILFSNSMVKIEKTSNIDFSKRYENPNTVYVVSSTSYTKPPVYKTETKSRMGMMSKAADTVLKKSKLGFYYKSPVQKSYNGLYSGTYGGEKLVIKTIKVNLDTEQYVLSYPFSYADTHLSVESRPWDITPRSNGMTDRFIDILVKETTKFFNIIADNKLKTQMVYGGYSGCDGDSVNVAELRKQTFIDLFGYKDGPKIQTNDIKILSHGFDLKESFRKRKETK